IERRGPGIKKKRSNSRIEHIPVIRHKYSEFVVSVLLNIYMITHCGYRKAILLFEYLNETPGWGIGEIPCFNSLENRTKKSGYSIYTRAC
ncbi:MAG: hypothetical protein LBL42_04890, partial [Tannerella sp.]|nr:hypothetical protein [Tannerella sp.]